MLTYINRAQNNQPLYLNSGLEFENLRKECHKPNSNNVERDVIVEEGNK